MPTADAALLDGPAPSPASLAVAPPSAVGTPGRRTLLACWGAAVLGLFLLRLGASPLFDVDEGAFAEATREMVASGDLGSTTLDGAPRFDKPILAYWLQAASVGALGMSERAVRLPSALCGWLWCLAVAWFAGRRWGVRLGVLAGTVLATSVGPLAIGRAATADALLDLLLTLALLDAWRHLESGGKAPLRRAHLWTALGLLAKGPVALLVPAAVTLVYCATRRDLRRWARLAFDLPGWALLLAVAGPWYAYALQRHGMAFVDGFLLRHNLARYTTPLEGHGGSLGYYVVMLPVMLLPWSALLPRVLHDARRRWGDPLQRFLLVWAAFVLAFFSFSGTKLPHYVLYGSTPVVLLLALAVDGAGPAVRRIGYALVSLLLAVLALAPALAPRVAPLVRDPLYRALLAGAPAAAGAPLAIGAATALAAWLAALPRLRSFPERMVAGSAALALVLAELAVPWLGGVLQGPVQRAAAVARARPEPAVQWKVRVPSFSFYRGASTPRATPAPGQLAITREAVLTESSGPFRVLYREGGYALVLLER